MEAVLDFLGAALPWIVMGLLLAVFFASNAGKKEDEKKSDNYGTEGMALGMCIGSAIGTALGRHTGVGMCLGMLIGLVIGTGIRKEGQSDDKTE